MARTVAAVRVKGELPLPRGAARSSVFGSSTYNRIARPCSDSTVRQAAWTPPSSHAGRELAPAQPM